MNKLECNQCDWKIKPESHIWEENDRIYAPQFHMLATNHRDRVSHTNYTYYTYSKTGEPLKREFALKPYQRPHRMDEYKGREFSVKETGDGLHFSLDSKMFGELKVVYPDYEKEGHYRFQISSPEYRVKKIGTLSIEMEVPDAIRAVYDEIFSVMETEKRYENIEREMQRFVRRDDEVPPKVRDRRPILRYTLSILNKAQGDMRKHTHLPIATILISSFIRRETDASPMAGAANGEAMKLFYRAFRTYYPTGKSMEELMDLASLTDQEHRDKSIGALDLAIEEVEMELGTRRYYSGKHILHE